VKIAEDVVVILKKRVLPERIKKWKEQTPLLAGGAGERFSAAAEAVILDILSALAVAAGDPGTKQVMDEEAEASVYGEVAAAMNAVLPVDYPYAVAVLKIKTELGYDFVALCRSNHRAFHELISTEIIPFIVAETRDDVEELRFELKIFTPDDEWP